MPYAALTTLAGVERLIHLQHIDSTNRYAKELQELPRQGLYVIVADTQSAGRGQRSNSFFSSVSGGLWVSLVIPIENIAHHFALNRALSLAIHQTLLHYAPGAPLCIKWPNDIYWGERKVCGILLEGIVRSRSYVVAGFGINVNIPREHFPPELQTIATSLAIETGKSFSMEALLEGIIGAFFQWRQAGLEQAHERYCSVLYRFGQSAVIGSVEGLFCGVEPDGQLCLEVAGELQRFLSGPMRFVEPQLGNAGGG
jgi:BirA family biotin operon repressor/biotin-[acetyl-CoA-carboxylase] ligase